MRARCTLVLLGLLAATQATLAGDMRTWTDWNKKTLEAKIVGFEKASLELSRKANALYANGVRYSQVAPSVKKLAEHFARKEGFENAAAALPKDSTGVKAFSYLNVVFHTKDGRTLKVPMDALEGSDDDTGDYKLAKDESVAWQEGQKQEPGGSDDAQRNEQERRRLEEDRRRLDDERRRMEKEHRWRDEQERRRWEDDMRRREAEHRLRDERLKRARDDHKKYEEDKKRADAEHRKHDEKAKAQAEAEKKKQDADRQRAEAERKKQADAQRKKKAEEDKKKQDAKKKR
jgi:hypothetical protein